eukprot:gene8188-biopygen10630
MVTSCCRLTPGSRPGTTSQHLKNPKKLQKRTRFLGGPWPGAGALARGLTDRGQNGPAGPHLTRGKKHPVCGLTPPTPIFLFAAPAVPHYVHFSQASRLRPAEEFFVDTAAARPAEKSVFRHTTPLFGLTPALSCSEDYTTELPPPPPGLYSPGRAPLPGGVAHCTHATYIAAHAYFRFLPDGFGAKQSVAWRREKQQRTRTGRGPAAGRTVPPRGPGVWGGAAPPAPWTTDVRAALREAAAGGAACPPVQETSIPQI